MLKTSTARRGNRIQWASLTQLDDLDFAEDLPLLSIPRDRAKRRPCTVVENSAWFGPKVHKDKSKVMKNNAAVSTNPMTLYLEDQKT